MSDKQKPIVLMAGDSVQAIDAVEYLSKAVSMLMAEKEELQQKVYSLESSEKALQAQLSTKALLVDSLRKNAERYRWLRDKADDAAGGYGVTRFRGSRFEIIVANDELDAAIDQARGAE